MLAVTRCLMGQHERHRGKTEHKTYTQDAIHGVLLESMDVRASATHIGRRSSTSRSIVHDTMPGAPVQLEARVCMLLFLGAADKGRLVKKSPGFLLQARRLSTAPRLLTTMATLAAARRERLI